jgi:hypothetical protein
MWKSFRGFLARLLSVVANLALVVLIALEYWHDGQVLLDQVIQAGGISVIPKSLQWHALDAPVLLVAVWANHYSSEAGTQDWFSRWVIDFIPSLLVGVVSAVTFGIALLAFESGFAWGKVEMIAPVGAFFVAALYDILFNQRKNVQRLANGKDMPIDVSANSGRIISELAINDESVERVANQLATRLEVILAAKSS